MKKNCVVCNIEFVLNFPNQRTCSKLCAIKLVRKGKRDEYSRNKTQYEKHHKKRRIRTRDFYRNHKLILTKFMGNKCSKCGLTPDDVNGCFGVFVVDEIIPLGRKRKFNSLTKKDLELTKKLFLAGKLQLLCQNCSAIKTWQCGDYCNSSIHT